MFNKTINLENTMFPLHAFYLYDKNTLGTMKRIFALIWTDKHFKRTYRAPTLSHKASCNVFLPGRYSI